MTALIFDTESTGITEPRLIEAAWLEVTPALEIKNRFHQRYNPGKPIELGALATHHIMDEDLQGCPAYSDFTLPPTTEYLIGHNVDYDWKLIGEPKVKRICTLALARYIWPDLDCHKQSALLYYINRAKAREQLKEAHTAEADVMNCMRVMYRILQVLEPQEKESWDRIWQVSEIARVPVVITFGKHKGTEIKKLPADYKSWLLKQDDVDPYLAKALRA